MTELMGLLRCLATGIALGYKLWRAGWLPGSRSDSLLPEPGGAVVSAEISLFDECHRRRYFEHCSETVAASRLATWSPFASAPDPVEGAMFTTVDRLLRHYAAVMQHGGSEGFEGFEGP